VSHQSGSPAFKARRSRREVLKRRASLVVNLDRRPKRFPCLVLDSSKEGFRLRNSYQLKRGQVVELILDDDPLRPVRCSVVWVGKASSDQTGESGLETVYSILPTRAIKTKS
jgi:hypothetical protein